jgi:hypothetical protein
MREWCCVDEKQTEDNSREHVPVQRARKFSAVLGTIPEICIKICVSVPSVQNTMQSELLLPSHSSMYQDSHGTNHAQ